MSSTRRFVILFDGVCNFCHFWVRFVFKNDKHKQFFFQPSQTIKGRDLLNSFNAPPSLCSDLSSVVLLDEKEKKYYTKAEAVAHICRHMGFPYNTVFYMNYLVPSFIGNRLYNGVASHRYAMFGKREDIACTYLPGLKDRFIDYQSPVANNFDTVWIGRYYYNTPHITYKIRVY